MVFKVDNPVFVVVPKTTRLLFIVTLLLNVPVPSTVKLLFTKLLFNANIPSILKLLFTVKLFIKLVPITFKLLSINASIHATSPFTSREYCGFDVFIPTCP